MTSSRALLLQVRRRSVSPCQSESRANGAGERPAGQRAGGPAGGPFTKKNLYKRCPIESDRTISGFFPKIVAKFRVFLPVDSSRREFRVADIILEADDRSGGNGAESQWGLEWSRAEPGRDEGCVGVVGKRRRWGDVPGRPRMSHGPRMSHVPGCLTHVPGCLTSQDWT